jgi:hypothetical protein
MTPIRKGVSAESGVDSPGSQAVAAKDIRVIIEAKTVNMVLQGVVLIPHHRSIE